MTEQLTQTISEITASTPIQHVYLLSRTEAQRSFLEAFLSHPQQYTGIKPPKWLEKGTQTKWDSIRRQGEIQTHTHSFPVEAVDSEQVLHERLEASGLTPESVVIITAADTQAEIILSPKNLSIQDKQLQESGFNVVAVGGMKKTNEAQFDSFRKAWGLLMGQAAYFRETTSSILWNAEAQRADEHVLSKAWFESHNHNPKSRNVKGKDGNINSIANFEFFNKPDDSLLHTLNARIERAKATDQRLTLYIPTCPPDTYYFAGGNTISYATEEPLQDGIAWTAENTLDALEALLPELKQANVPLEIVFGIGDYEYYLGYERGMTEDAFRQAVNRTEQHLAHRVQTLIQQTYQTRLEIETTPSPTKGVNEIRLSGGNNYPIVRITGMMELAGGREEWNRRFATAREQAAAIFDQSSRYNRLAQITLTNRQAMVDFWLQMRGYEITQEARIEEFTSRDLPSYLAFHQMVQEQFGDRLIILAGDSRPMENLAATTIHNPLITVSGLYKGADFK